MRVNWRTRLPIAGGILAVALAAGGCTKTSDNYDTRGTAGTSGTIGGTAADRGTESVMLTGCLQKGSGMNNFILTQVNTAPHTVGTTGATSTSEATPSAGSDTVGREQSHAAAQSYRVDGDNSTLNDLVGKQVRVMGRVTDRGDLNKTDQNREERGTYGKADRDINQSDLARVSVDSIDKVSDSCSSAGNRQQ